MIISLQDGRWAAVEVKLGSREIEEGAEHLKKLASKIDTDKFPAPSFLMVLTGGEFAYRRADGVFVIPIGCRSIITAAIIANIIIAAVTPTGEYG